jgi:acetyltransferase-like isoleucine patch superfamily enzyme
MPIGIDHAFGNGSAYKREQVTSQITWWRLNFFKSPTFRKASKAWQQFDLVTQSSDEVMLGANAWCINGQNHPDSIQLKGRVICRGLLRVEYFGSGHIFIHPEVYIGDDCLISCSNSVEIGSYTMIAHGVHIFDNDTHPINWQERLKDWQLIVGSESGVKPLVASAPIKIGQHVWVGFGSLIFKGITIGDRSIIAAGSVVTKDVPSDVMVAGNPAKVIKSVN